MSVPSSRDSVPWGDDGSVEAVAALLTQALFHGFQKNWAE